MGQLTSVKVNSQLRAIFCPGPAAGLLERHLCLRQACWLNSLPCLLCSPLGLGIVRASSVFPILSTILLLLGGLCIGAGRIYSRKNNIVLSAGILFVAAGMRAAPLQTGAEAIVERNHSMWLA